VVILTELSTNAKIIASIQQKAERTANIRNDHMIPDLNMFELCDEFDSKIKRHKISESKKDQENE
jgi:hypothetical protein